MSRVIFAHKRLLSVAFVSVLVHLGTCISVLGLGMAHAGCMCITPNKGSGAPSASSRRDRASGKSRAFLRETRRRGSKTRESFCIFKCRQMCEMLSRCSHLLSSSKSIFWDVLAFTSWPMTDWRSSGRTQGQEPVHQPQHLFPPAVINQRLIFLPRKIAHCRW